MLFLFVVQSSAFRKSTDLDILLLSLQEDGDDSKLSVFRLFSELFPEVANINGMQGPMTYK